MRRSRVRSASVRLRCALLYLQRAAGVAARPREPGVTQAVLVQTVSVTSTVVLTGWTDVEVLHRPLRIRMPLIEAEPHRSVDDSRIIKLCPCTCMYRNTSVSVCLISHVSARLSGRGYTARFHPSAGKKTDGCDTCPAQRGSAGKH